MQIGAGASYDFSSAASQAAGNNQVLVDSSPDTVYAFYSGDINDDGNVDNFDYAIWEIDSNAFAIGDYETDLNGDGIVEFTDYTIWESNTNQFISSIRP